MTAEILIAVVIGSIVLGAGGVWFFAVRKSAPGTRKKKPAKKKATPWMTVNQLEALKKIAATGSAGIKLWYTDINISTIRSLAKRGMVDTASKGRIVATAVGRLRLRQPWPPEQPTGDQKASTGSDESNVSNIGSSAASKEVGALTSKVD